MKKIQNRSQYNCRPYFWPLKPKSHFALLRWVSKILCCKYLNFEQKCACSAIKVREICLKYTSSSKKRSIHLSAIQLSLRSTSNLDPPPQRFSNLMLQPSNWTHILSHLEIPIIHFFFEIDQNFQNRSQYTWRPYFGPLNPKSHFALLRWVSKISCCKYLNFEQKCACSAIKVREICLKFVYIFFGP